MLLRRLIAPFWTRLFYYFFFLGINPWFFSRSDKVCGGNRGCKYWRHLVYDKPSGLHYFWQRWHKPPLKWESVGGCLSVCLSEIAMCHLELANCLRRKTKLQRPLSVFHGQKTTIYWQGPPDFFFLPLALWQERTFLEDQLIKLEKLSRFWTHEHLLQVWHRNIDPQRQV